MAYLKKFDFDLFFRHLAKFYKSCKPSRGLICWWFILSILVLDSDKNSWLETSSLVLFNRWLYPKIKVGMYFFQLLRSYSNFWRLPSYNHNNYRCRDPIISKNREIWWRNGGERIFSKVSILVKFCTLYFFMDSTLEIFSSRFQVPMVIIFMPITLVLHMVRYSWR
jgi:hypothetical protein